MSFYRPAMGWTRHRREDFGGRVCGDTGQKGLIKALMSAVKCATCATYGQARS